MPTARPVAELFTPFFEDLTDPRLERTKRHTLVDIIVLAVCATLGKRQWLGRQQATLQSGPSSISSARSWNCLTASPRTTPIRPRLRTAARSGSIDGLHPTVARRGLGTAVAGEVVAIDGKTLAGFRSTRRLAESACIWLSAWACSTLG